MTATSMPQPGPRVKRAGEDRAPDGPAAAGCTTEAPADLLPSRGVPSRIPPPSTEALPMALDLPNIVLGETRAYPLVIADAPGFPEVWAVRGADGIEFQLSPSNPGRVGAVLSVVRADLTGLDDGHHDADWIVWPAVRNFRGPGREEQRALYRAGCCRPARDPDRWYLSADSIEALRRLHPSTRFGLDVLAALLAAWLRRLARAEEAAILGRAAHRRHATAGSWRGRAARGV